MAKIAANSAVMAITSNVAAAPTNRSLVGTSLIVLGLLLASLQDVAIRSLSDAYSVGQIVFVRGLVAIAMLVGIIIARHGVVALTPSKPRRLLLRGGLSFMSYTAFYMALAQLPMANVVAIFFSAPIIAGALSALLLKESVGARRWAALAVGFIAVLIIIAPEGKFDWLATSLAMASAFFYALSALVTRTVTNENPWTITLFNMLMFTLGGVVIFVLAWCTPEVNSSGQSLAFLFRDWSIPSPGDFALMLFIGINGTLSIYCLIKAYWTAPIGAVAPFEYSYIIWAILFGYAFWGEIPSWRALGGVALLIAGSLYLLQREQQLIQAGKLRARGKMRWRVARG